MGKQPWCDSTGRLFCFQNEFSHFIVLPIERSTREGYVLTRVCPSVCLSTEWVPPPPPAGDSPPPPPAGQQMEYLVRGGWNASCVHAGGLSCSQYFRLSLKAVPGLNPKLAMLTLSMHCEPLRYFFTTYAVQIY